MSLMRWFSPQVHARATCSVWSAPRDCIYAALIILVRKSEVTNSITVCKSVESGIFKPFRGKRHYSGALFFLSFFFTASIVRALGSSNLFSSNTICLGKRFLSWKFRVALYSISYKQLTMKKCKDFKLNSVIKSFYTKIYWYLVYGRFKGRWLRIQYQILKIQNGGSNMAAWS